MTQQLKFTPLGGIGGVTKNMYLYEYANQILIVDCGIGFPESAMLGVDVLIPDISYLKGKEDQIIGMLLTHAHDDHIAALPYILPELPQIPVYASRLTAGFAQDRLRDFDVKQDFTTFPDNTSLKLGPFEIESIKITHSVPDARHFAIHTPVGTFYHGSDFKFDLTPVDGVVSDYQKIARIGSQGVLGLFSDALRSEKTGHSLSESILAETFEREFQNVRGKVLVTSMSSNVHRIQQAVNTAVKNNRKVAFIGWSVEQNTKTATKLGFFNAPKKSIIHKRSIGKYKPNQVCVIIAGSQGQPESSLTRAAIGTHSMIQIKPEDKVIFSTEPIPGNEDNVYAAIDNISRIGADISYSDVDDNLHVSGHAYALELKLLMELVKPKFLVPIGGTYRHMVQYRNLAASMGHQPNNVFLLEDGQTILFGPNSAKLGPTVKLRHVMVDGTGIGDVGNIVLNDRRTMANSGMLVVIIPTDSNGHPQDNIQVISRGFVFMKRSKNLIHTITDTVKDEINKHQSPLNWKNLKRAITHQVQDKVYQLTQREPLVLIHTLKS